MLVITRRPNESFIIEPNGTSQRIEVIVLEMKGRQMRLGIKAPREIAINRTEVLARKRQVQQQGDLQE